MTTAAKETIPVRNALRALVLLLGLVSPAVASDDQLTAQDVAQLKHLMQPKFLVAEVIEAAGFAATRRGGASPCGITWGPRTRRW